MKNFDFITLLEKHIPSFSQLHTYCDKAEMFQKSFPEESAGNARKALEWLVKNFMKMSQVELDPHETLNDMLKRPEMDVFIDDDWEFQQDIRTVKKIGNFASHFGAPEIKKNDAFICLRSLYYVVVGFLYRWKAIKDIAPFDATLIPTSFSAMQVATSDEPEVSVEVVNSVPQEAIDNPTKPGPKPKESLASEKITRKCLIDYMLNEAKWDVLTKNGDIQGGKACVEVKVEGVTTNPSGIGYCDYVLFSNGGKPYAVIEAKSTIQNASKGRKQAIEYADCLEQKYGVRPVIYYTNGYTTKVIDGLGYPDREVISFHSHDDLEYLIQKRGRANITDLTIDDAITDRSYQKTAIKSLVEWLNKKHQRGLLVLATGTGKTRVSISLCKVLSNNNWIKNVLFLADRTELVHQAKGNFEKLLPSESMTSLSEEDVPDLQARFVFSTYQTMINYINAADLKFSVGHFDLIILDEAHRSVFGKYGAIFQYFDSLLIGLTATPRHEIDKSTFKLLDLEEPNYEYSFQEAVDDHFLVPYKAKIHHSKMIDRGIRYNDLSKEQKEELEKVWEYEKALKGIDKSEEYHRDIKGNEIFSYLINDDTIDNVLTELMTNGLSIKSGEDIGKTIIFAYNHKHAERIVERFHTLYPERGSDYCQLIDNQVKKHEAIIADFKVANKNPQVAVSVDMLDTGIDVPEILNLVFFKIVKSKIKFEQMIGRGTRLCPDIFGPGKDKELFYIFDWCGNFEYFSSNPEGIDSSEAKTLSDRLFSLRLDIAKELQSAEHQEKDFDKKLHGELKAILHVLVNGINKERKDARPYWNTIEPFRDKERWTYISDVDVLRLKELGQFVPQSSDDESAKKFDVIMLQLQLAHIDSNTHFGQFKKVVIQVAGLLEKMATVPAVKEHMETIRTVQQPQFWENESLDGLEKVRVELRELVKLLEETRKTKKFIIDIDDTYNSIDGSEMIFIQKPYKQRVIEYLTQNSDNLTLRKIQNFEQLTASDFHELERIFFEEVGTKKEYEALSEGHPYKRNVAAFIRVINGIDRQKALEIYKHFIEGHDLTSEQEMYLKNILDYVSVNGDIETRNFTEYPLKDLNWRATFGDHFVNLKDFVKQIHQVISA